MVKGIWHFTILEQGLFNNCTELQVFELRVSKENGQITCDVVLDYKTL